MPFAFSIYLETARIFATLLVFVAHGFVFYEPLREVNEFYRFGRDGVIIFFVLSGYVITWCANERDNTVLTYAINRASRIYSVAIPGIVLGVAASLYVFYFFDIALEYSFNKPWLYLPIYLTFTGDFWTLSEVPPGNFPYWSLNFEVWYYVIFAAFFYIRSWLRWPFAIGLSVLVGPTIIQLFPLWIAGSLLYHFIDRISMPETVSRLVLAATILAYVALKFMEIDTTLDTYNAAAWKFFFNSDQPPNQLLGDYLIAVVVIVNFIAFWNANLQWNDRITNPIRYVASFSFSFYLYHIPVYTVLHSHFPENASALNYVTIMVAVTLFIFALARYTEHKKGAYRAFFKRLAAPIAARFEPAAAEFNKR